MTLHTYRRRGDKHVADCTENELRNWIKYSFREPSCSVDALTHSKYWPDGWAIWPVEGGGYSVVDDSGRPLAYETWGDTISGDTIFATAARAYIVSRRHGIATMEAIA